MLRKEVDARHPEYVERKDLWQNVYVLYEGGRCMKENAGLFLKARPKEDGSVYQYRLDHFCYENNLGTGLGWHEAEMFRNPPSIDIARAGKNGQPEMMTGKDGVPVRKEIDQDQKAFYDRFQKDCDRHGTSFVDKYRKVFTDLLLYQQAWVLTDLPVPDDTQPVLSLADQKAKGLLDPFIQVIAPMNVINWDVDEYGNLLWAVIYSKVSKRTFGEKPVDVERWYYYDQTGFRVFEATSDSGTPVGDNQPVTMVREGVHALAGTGRLPLQRITVPAGWWMGNRTYLACIEHLNISNALKWSLFMAAMAMPVVCTDDDVTDIHQSEAGFLKFSQGSTYQFAEPAGNCWEHMARRTEVLKEEIYRSLYLIAQSRTTSATASAQSGVSKEQDMKPSHDVLNGLGDILRAAMQCTLQNLAIARSKVPGMGGDADLLFDVRGFQFDDAVTTEDVDKLTGLYGLKVPSKRFEKELDKKVAVAALPDMNPETKAVIFDEIDTAPTREELIQQQKEADAKRMAASLDAAVAA